MVSADLWLSNKTNWNGNHRIKIKVPNKGLREQRGYTPKSSEALVKSPELISRF